MRVDASDNDVVPPASLHSPRCRICCIAEWPPSLRELTTRRCLCVAVCSVVLVRQVRERAAPSYALETTHFSVVRPVASMNPLTLPVRDDSGAAPTHSVRAYAAYALDVATRVYRAVNNVIWSPGPFGFHVREMAKASGSRSGSLRGSTPKK